MKGYYIQYRTRTDLSHVPFRKLIIAKDITDFANIIEREHIQDQIDILAIEELLNES